MIYEISALLTGLGIGTASTVLAQRKKILRISEKHKTELRNITIEMKECADASKQASKLTSNENSDQHELSIQKINEAFHTGSTMMEEMASSLTNIEKQVQSTEEPIRVIHTTGNEALNNIEGSKRSIDKLTTSIEQMTHISALVTSLSDRMNEVNTKTQLIHNIADQANLLSLNAAIEAARAGEAGRGFGVVANDMNRLADSSSVAAREISKILSVGLKDIESITNEINEKSEVFQGVSDDVIGTFNTMNTSINEISTLTTVLENDAGAAIQNVKNVSETTQTTMESLTKLLSDVTGIISGNSIDDLPPNEIIDKIDDYIVIDVRNPHEFNDELGHISSATLYCLSDNFKDAISSLDNEENYLFVCRSGGRSARGARVAQALGFKHVTNMSGGMLKWKELSYPVA